MKNVIPLIPCLLAMCAFAAGCEHKTLAPSGPGASGQLSANELALLLDLHVWKLPVAQSQQPFTGVELVLLQPDGSSTREFGIGDRTHPAAWTNILVGFHFKLHGVFGGQFVAQGPMNSVAGPLNFTNALAELPRTWTFVPQWNGNRAELATFWTTKEATDYGTLAIELVK